MSSGGSSALGARLGEMDRLLRDIQVELAPDREPAPVLVDEPAAAAVPDAEPEPVLLDEPTAAVPDAEPPPPPCAEPAPHITELSARLLASIRELLAGYEQVLTGRSVPQPARRAVRPRADAPDVTLSAAPFASLEALREFEHAVSGLPGVRDVVIRGYEGADRAIIEVRLDQGNP